VAKLHAGDDGSISAIMYGTIFGFVGVLVGLLAYISHRNSSAARGAALAELAKKRAAVAAAREEARNAKLQKKKKKGKAAAKIPTT